ncbi:hypothetical protein JQX03_15645 [Sulfitobacter pseudonitzschiae]|nr:hypothetical protein [Pseudosulfitobacter pseudonitzschiae]
MTLSVKSASDRLAGDWVRAAKSIAASSNIMGALEHAEKSRASDRAIELLRTKAASTAATLADPNWAGHIADQDGVAAAFIDSLRSASLFYRFAGLANVFPLSKRVVASAALELGGAKGEGVWLPVVTGSFTPITLTPRKTGGIVVASKELVDATDPASFAVLRRELQSAAIAAVDTAFLAVALDGVTATPTTDLLGEVETLLLAVGGTGSEALIFMAGNNMAKRLATASISPGGRLFPEMGPNGGKIVNVDCLASNRIDSDTLILIDASGFSVNDGTVDVDLARGATLQMKTDPADEATTMVSMLQTNSVALRVIAAFGCEMSRANSVAAITLPTGE